MNNMKSKPISFGVWQYDLLGASLVAIGLVQLDFPVATVLVGVSGVLAGWCDWYNIDPTK
jgi:hypothetical protein